MSVGHWGLQRAGATVRRLGGPLRSILRQNVNLAKLPLDLLYTLGAERVRMTVPPARYRLQPSLLGTIAMEIAGEQSPNGFSFSVKTQTKSAFEILVLAIPRRVGCLCFRAASSAGKMVSWLLGTSRR